MDFDTLHIMPGYNCNFSCSHCVNESGPKRHEQMSESEVEEVLNYIKSQAPKRIQFTGGEPTLYTDLINRFITIHPNPDNLTVVVTTNGWFGSSETKIRGELDKFAKLDSVLLSFDLFHRKKVDPLVVDRIHEYCEKSGINFAVSVCISRPTDLLKAQKVLSETKAKITYQKVESSGRAKTEKVAFEYPTLDLGMLDTKCPNLGTLNYIANKGFTDCCSNLVFNHDPSISTSRSYEEYINSEFHSRLSNMTVRDMLDEAGVDVKSLTSEFSSPCRGCELAHTRR